MRDTRTWRESLTDYEDIDELQHRIATALGIVDAMCSMDDVKPLYWTTNPVGDALADLVFALARAGVLQADPHDETRMRWNPGFEALPR